MSGNICTYQRLPKIVRYSESKDRLVKPAIRHSQSCLRNSSVKSVSVPPTQQPISSAEQRRLSHHTFTATSALNLVMAKFPAHHNLRGLPSCPLIQALSSVGLSCYKFHPSVAEEGGGGSTCPLRIIQLVHWVRCSARYSQQKYFEFATGRLNEMRSHGSRWRGRFPLFVTEVFRKCLRIVTCCYCTRRVRSNTKHFESG